MLYRMLLVSLLALSQLSCASYFKRKTCESTNWREHGKSVALSGKRLDADPFIQECQKVEAEFSFAEADLGFKEGMNQYCNYNHIFNEGKKGKEFNYALCDGLSEKKMKARHQAGVKAYCQPDNGFTVGQSGTVYNNICPKELEPGFMSEYRRGRKIYLTQAVHNKERESDQINQQIQNLRYDRESQVRELTMLTAVNATRVVQRERVFDPATNSYREEERRIEDPTVQRRRETLEQKIREIEGDIRGFEAKKIRVHEEIRALKQELAGL